MPGDDCTDYICTSGKDEEQLSQLLSASAGHQARSRYVPDRLPRSERPLNVMQLGNSTWPLLHRMSLSYPERPGEE